MEYYRGDVEYIPEEHRR